MDNLGIQEVKALYYEKMLKNRAMDSGRFALFFYLPVQRSRALSGDRKEENTTGSRQFSHLIYTEFHISSNILLGF